MEKYSEFWDYFVTTVSQTDFRTLKINAKIPWQHFDTMTPYQYLRYLEEHKKIEPSDISYIENLMIHLATLERNRTSLVSQLSRTAKDQLIQKLAEYDFHSINRLMYKWGVQDEKILKIEGYDTLSKSERAQVIVNKLILYMPVRDLAKRTPWVYYPIRQLLLKLAKW